MDFLGKKARHTKFGAGTVIAFDGSVIAVFFEQYGAHYFRYPDALSEGLKLQDA